MNLFECEIPIIERLKSEVTGVAHVGSASSIAGYNDLSGKLPALLVMPNQSNIPKGPYDGMAQKEDQQWEVVVIVEHQKDQVTGDTDTTVQKAGEIAGQVLTALVGWSPAQGYQTLAHINRPVPFYDIGYAEFPLLFSTSHLLIGSGA